MVRVGCWWFVQAGPIDAKGLSLGHRYGRYSTLGSRRARIAIEPAEPWRPVVVVALGSRSVVASWFRNLALRSTASQMVGFFWELACSASCCVSATRRTGTSAEAKVVGGKFHRFETL